jgi:hypothetical protein
MSARARLATFVAGLIALFGVSYAVAGAVVPDDVVDRWQERVEPAGTQAHTDDDAGDEHGTDHD